MRKKKEKVFLSVEDAIKASRGKCIRRIVYNCIWLLLWVLCLATELGSGYPTTSNVIIFSGLFVMNSVFIFRRYFQIQGLKNYDDYILHLEKSENNTIEELMAATNHSRKEILRGLKTFKDLNLVRVANVDSQGVITVFDNEGNSLITTLEEKKAKRNAKLIQRIMVTCPHCGAKKEVDPKEYNRCDYCGSKLET